MNSVERGLRKIAREVLLKYRCKARYDLERKMFPKIRGKRVLFVGIANYTKDYPKKLKNNEIWTIDINSEVEKFGAKNHIVGSITEVDTYFPENFFDYIFFCGILGFGVNTETDAEKTFEKCCKILKKDGILIIGWDSFYSKVIPNQLKSFKLFKPVSRFGFPIGYQSRNRERKSDERTKYAHNYDFLMKE
jgi:hypothetical protein